MSFSDQERARLAEALLSVGPSAPTMCEGWSAHHLAAHLYLREHLPAALIGIFVPPVAGVTERAMHKLLDQDFEDLVQRWGRGPVGIWRLLDARINVAEHFVHLEDVRRAAGLGPRSFSTAEADALEAALRSVIWLYRKSRCWVELVPEGRLPMSAGDQSSAQRVQISGPVGELLLFSYGRQAEGLYFDGDRSLLGSRSV